jgi:AcrR family transcriptional regulator
VGVASEMPVAEVPPGRGPRRRMAPDDRRRALMMAALELFNARPYDQVSVDDIAAAADMSRPLLYHYYGGKLGVFLAALRQAADELLAVVRVAAERSPETWLSSGLVAYLDHVQESPISFTVLVGHGASPAGDEGETIAGRLREEILNLLLEGLQPAGEPPMLRSVIKGWIGLVEVISRQWLQTGQPARSELERILIELFDAALQTTARNDPAVREALASRRWQ